jgi:cobalt/nickel transport system ATP-binding protein
MEILRTENLDYRYENDQKALDDVSIKVHEGEKIVLLGPNGAGKSTLFMALNGLIKPTGGKVFFMGKELQYDQKSISNLRRNVGFVFQNPDDQLLSSTVEEDVAFGPMNLGLTHSDVEKRIKEALELVGMEKLAERNVLQLSFGQRKRVALAGILAMKPKVLLMDEPTAGLDSEMVHEMLELADELNESGITIMISTHDIETAYEWADEVIAMRQGKCVYGGSSAGLFEMGEALHGLAFTKPLGLMLNNEFEKHRKTPSKSQPRNFSQYSAKFFSENYTKNGRIILYCIDNPPAKMPKVKHENIGVYGIHARRDPDVIAKSHHRFHAIDYALLGAAKGETFLLYTNSPLCGIVEKKVADFNKLAKLKIEVEHIHG